MENGNHNKFIKNESKENDGYGLFVLDEVFANIFKNNECLANGLGDSNLPGIC